MISKFFLLTITIPLFISCNSEQQKEKVEQQQSEVNTETVTNESSTTSNSINLEINFEVEEVQNGVVFSGSTNLPDGTILGISLEQEATNFTATDFDIKVSDGKYTSPRFSNKGQALNGEYEAELMSYFTKQWQPEELLTELDKFTGDLIQTEENEIIGEVRKFKINKTLTFENEQPESPKIKYSVINKVLSLPHKASYDVRIFEKLSESQLRVISRELQRKSQNATRVFVVFYLPGMEVDAGGWATAHKGEDVRIMEYMLNSNPTTLNN
ncbi:MAG: hypothetical protein WDZ80_04290 [Candidatus Paceibacterota bacterium]